MKKTTKTKALSRVTLEILETADDMHRIGIRDGKTHHQITVRPEEARNFFRVRAAKAKPGALLRALDAVPDHPPAPGDELEA